MEVSNSSVGSTLHAVAAFSDLTCLPSAEKMKEAGAENGASNGPPRGVADPKFRQAGGDFEAADLGRARSAVASSRGNEPGASPSSCTCTLVDAAINVFSCIGGDIVPPCLTSCVGGPTNTATACHVRLAALCRGRGCSSDHFWRSSWGYRWFIAGQTFQRVTSRW